MRNVFIIIIIAAFLLSGCVSLTGKKASPMEIGYGLQLDPGMQIGSTNNSAHLLLSYARLSFDGGHDNMYQIGGQFRHYHDSFDKGGLWYGGEMAYVRFTSIYDESLFVDSNPRAGGFALGGLAGYKFPCKKIPFSGYVSLGLVNFGDFKAGDVTFDAGGTGFTFRVGISLHLTSLFFENGR
ncbi:MAG: hypothetical protein K9G58_03445 [Bacteroidales bacterium]|nr:hypothetical protein [Bacteroidales bacterium]MCF8388182.1 hypothetical protein [Bacteroidales bacterium]MCF8397197.1 hypothetical protein [Bacteroidales bacterium]